MMMDEPEFSRPLPIEKIPASGVEQTVEANVSECKKLAERFGLLDLGSLKAQYTVQPKGLDQSYNVIGKITADVVQQCVVSLEPLPLKVEQDIEVLFALPELIDPVAASPTIEMDREDTEAIVDGLIDLGELTSQYLGMALDPYPRKPGLSFVESKYGDDAPETSPFAKLAELKKKPKE